MYAFFEKTRKNAIVVFKIDDVGGAVEILGNNGISILPENIIRNL